MRLRALVICALAGTLVAPALPAVAAKKAPPPVCHLLTDAKGDGASAVGGAVFRSEALDIVGADVATGKKTLVGVLRVAKTSADGDAVTMAGMSLVLSFEIRNNVYKFIRRRAYGPTAPFTDTFVGGNPNSISLTPTVSATEIRWTVPRSAVPDLAKAKSVVTDINVGSTWFAFSADGGGTAKTYADLTPSCLKAT